jgi:DNA repair protein RecO (recombination protein O)
MPLVSTEAFVLRSYKLAENDKIVVLFSRAFGKIRLVAKGARKMKNRFGAALEVFSHVRVLFHEKENRDLLVLDKAEILYSPFEKQARLRTNFFLFYFAELIHEFYPEREKNPAAFRILLNIERAIQNQQNLDYLARYVELQLLHSQGVLSSVAACSYCSRAFESLLERRYLGASTEVFCKRCRNQESMLLSTQVVKSIDAFERGSVSWADTMPGQILEELGSLNRILITRFLGKDLQTPQFRKILGEDKK